MAQATKRHPDIDLSGLNRSGEPGSGHPAAADGRFAKVDGWPINIANLEDAVERIIAAAAARQGFACFTLNLDHLVKLRGDARFRRAYQRARFITADGEPVARIVRRQWPSVVRTTGADMLVPLCQAAATKGVPVYFFGTSTAVLEATITRLGSLTDGRLRVAGYEAPPLGFYPDGAAADAAIDRIAASGAQLCFAMLGAPKQEIFSARAVERGVRCGFVGVGAAADFIVGHQVRAPRMMQSVGLEWLWRLSQNPRRLALRYARCAMVLADIELARLRPLRGKAG